MSHPYKDLPDKNFWAKAVTWAPPGQIDPVSPAERIQPAHRVATMVPANAGVPTLRDRTAPGPE